MLAQWSGITIFTDKYIQYHDKVRSRVKIAWIMEPRAYDPKAYNLLESTINHYDLILTYDEKLLKLYPEKCRFLPADGLFIDTKSIRSANTEKDKMCSHIYSDKKILDGHRLRHEIAEEIKKTNLKKNIDFWGRGTNFPLEQKSLGLNSYYFSIVVENNRANNYFTEKILDCFATKTIPIYWGAPNIEKWFDKNSIMTFENITDLINILKSLNKEKYVSKIESINKNYKKSLEYYDYDEIVYSILKKSFPNETRK
jgi:hypothetical protein